MPTQKPAVRRVARIRSEVGLKLSAVASIATALLLVANGTEVFLGVTASGCLVAALLVHVGAADAGARDRAWSRGLVAILAVQAFLLAAVAFRGVQSGAEIGLPLAALVVCVHLQRRESAESGLATTAALSLQGPTFLSVVALAMPVGLATAIIDVGLGTLQGHARFLPFEDWLEAAKFAVLAHCSFAFLVGLLIGGAGRAGHVVWARGPRGDALDRGLFASLGMVAIAALGVVALLYRGTHYEIAYPPFVPTILQGGPWIVAAASIALAMGITKISSSGHVGPGPLVAERGAPSDAPRRLLVLGLVTIVVGTLWVTFNLSSRQLGNDSYARIIDCGSTFIIVTSTLLAAGLVTRGHRWRGRAPGVISAGVGLAAVVFAASASPNTASLGLRSFELTWGATRMLRGVSDFDGDGYSALFGDGDPAGFDSTSSPATRTGLESLYAACTGEPYSPNPDRLLSGVASRPETAALRARNLILITVDALRADAMSLYGSQRDTSPELAARAESGVVFDRCYTAATATHCSLRSLGAGHLQERLQQYNGAGRSVDLAPTIFEAAMESERFDRYQIVANSDALADAAVPDGTTLRRLDPDLDAADLYRQIHQEIIDGGRDERFCVWVHHMDVHFPYVQHPDAPNFGSEKRDLYDSAIHRFDADLGVFLDRLAADGFLEETLVVFTADHGVEFREHGVLYHGQQVYEESARVPLVFLHPDLAPARVEAPVSLIDLAPTFAELFGVNDTRLRYEGFSLVPALLGEAERPTSDRDIVTISGRQDSWCLIAEEEWKLIYQRDSNSWELYHLAEDPNEYRNLYLEEPQRARDLSARLLGYMIRGFDRHGTAHHWQPRADRTWR